MRRDTSGFVSAVTVAYLPNMSQSKQTTTASRDPLRPSTSIAALKYLKVRPGQIAMVTLRELAACGIPERALGLVSNALARHAGRMRRAQRSCALLPSRGAGRHRGRAERQRRHVGSGGRLLRPLAGRARASGCFILAHFPRLAIAEAVRGAPSALTLFADAAGPGPRRIIL